MLSSVHSPDQLVFFFIKTVQAKGKGELQTYWLNLNVCGGTKSTSGESNMNDSDKSDTGTTAVSRKNSMELDSLLVDSEQEPKQNPAAMAKIQIALHKKNDIQDRLVKWNVDVLAKVLREIVARRKAGAQEPDSVEYIKTLEQDTLAGDVCSLDEATEVIRLPEFNVNRSIFENPESIELGPEVLAQLDEYIKAIAAMYRPNAFHNFEVR
jgi:hypothetical protein